MVLADVPGSPCTKNLNESRFRCSPVPKTGTRLHSDVRRHQKPERGHIRQNHPLTKPPFSFLSNRSQKRHINIWYINDFSVTAVTDPPGRAPGRKCHKFLGLRTQHINVWPLATLSGDPPPSPRQSPDKVIDGLLALSFPENITTRKKTRISKKARVGGSGKGQRRTNIRTDESKSGTHPCLKSPCLEALEERTVLASEIAAQNRNHLFKFGAYYEARDDYTNNSKTILLCNKCACNWKINSQDPDNSSV